MIINVTPREPLSRMFIEGTSREPICNSPVTASLSKDGTLKINGPATDKAKRIVHALMGLVENGAPAIDKITINPDGSVWIVVALHVGLSPEKIIGFIEGVLTFATP